MFTKSLMYSKNIYHSQMRHRGQRGLILRYSNCTDLEWLRHFRACFSQVLVGKVSGFLFIYLFFTVLHMLTLYVPQTSWLQHSANHDCNLSAAADSCCSLQTCCSPSGRSSPITPCSKLQAGTLQCTRILVVPVISNHRYSKHAC